MIAKDEDALICDFAETYHVFDYKSLPPAQAAIFAAGLPDDSRVKRSITGRKVTNEITLLATIADILNILAWQNTKDGQRGSNKPKSILQSLTEDVEEYEAFDSIEAYEAARAKIMEN